MFSRSTEYGLRALVYLARQPAGKQCGASEIAEAEKIPMPFLWKILQDLTRKRLLRSSRGVRGGYALTKPATNVTLADVLKKMKSLGPLERCILGYRRCDDSKSCILHEQWTNVRDEMMRALTVTTLADATRRPSGRRKRR